MEYIETDALDMENQGVRMLTCVQTAGDVMIVPEAWGHGVLNIQESVAVATEYKFSFVRSFPPVLSIIGENIAPKKA